MTLSEDFVAAAGSVTGREHRRAERDSQDGYALVVTDDLLAAVVTDGCSSGRASEIGARVGAAWIAALVEQRFHGLSAGDPRAAVTRAAEEVTRELRVRLELLARSFDASGDVRATTVDRALLFGFLVAVVTPETTIVFGIGDGLVGIDGGVSVIDPGPENAPPYVSYGLLGTPIEPRVHFVGETSEIDLVLVATDGLAPLAPAAIDELASDGRYEKNPSLLRKRLVVLSDAGQFSDDATMAVIRRARGRSAAS